MTFIIQVKAKHLTLRIIYFQLNNIPKKQNINNIIINHITKRNTTNNTENVLNAYKTYVSNNYKSQIAYVENNLYKRSDNRTFNNTNNIYKHINQYKSYVLNNYKIN